MNSPDAFRYAEILSGPFTEALDSIESVKEGPTSLLRLAGVQKDVITATRNIDWLAFSVDEPPPGDSRSQLKISAPAAARYAEKLVDFAFSDCWQLFNHCEKVAARNGMKIDSGFGAALRNSRSLLQVTMISDEHKKRLMQTVQRPTIARYRLGIVLQGEPIRLNYHASGSFTFGFDRAIIDWINASFQPDSGCPARYIFIEDTNGRKQQLTKYLWIKLTEAVYG
ncbi:MAG: hypothetical protein ACYCPS_04315 [Candidatus Saccharimonadales bacterium]